MGRVWTTRTIESADQRGAHTESFSTSLCAKNALIIRPNEIAM